MKGNSGMLVVEDEVVTETEVIGLELLEAVEVVEDCVELAERELRGA